MSSEISKTSQQFAFLPTQPTALNAYPYSDLINKSPIHPQQNIPPSDHHYM